MHSARNEMNKKKNNAQPRDKTSASATNASVCEKMTSTGAVAKLFDRKFIATALRDARCCPKCRNEYSTNYDHRLGDGHVKSHRPFLLTCGHNMCENCIYQNHQHLICNICQVPIQVETPNHYYFNNRNESFYVRNYFYMNFFLIGELYHFRFYRRETSANNTLMISTNNSHNPQLPSSSGVGACQVLGPARAQALSTPAVLRCTECEVEPAVGLCRQCSVYYCRICYDSIHMYGKALKRHTFVPLNGDGSGVVGRERMPRPSYCRMHRRTKDRFCRTCKTVCCVLCAKVEHPNHRWSSLACENEMMKDEITNFLESVKMSRENLRKAQKVSLD